MGVMKYLTHFWEAEINLIIVLGGHEFYNI